MYRTLMYVALGAAVLGVSACGGGETEKPKTTAPATRPPAEGRSNSPSLGVMPTAASLAGSAWMLGDVSIDFIDEDSAYIKGGPLEKLAPEGLEIPYSLEDGVIEASIMGQTRTGTWDGTTLTIDGSVAELR